MLTAATVWGNTLNTLNTIVRNQNAQNSGKSSFADYQIKPQAPRVVSSKRLSDALGTWKDSPGKTTLTLNSNGTGVLIEDHIGNSPGKMIIKFVYSIDFQSNNMTYSTTYMEFSGSAGYDTKKSYSKDEQKESAATATFKISGNMLEWDKRTFYR